MDIINIAGGQKPSHINNAKGEGAAYLTCWGKETQRRRIWWGGLCIEKCCVRDGIHVSWVFLQGGGDPLLTKVHELVKVELAAV